MTLNFDEDAQMLGLGAVNEVAFWGTAVATGVPEVGEAHFALFKVGCAVGCLGFVWARWCPFKRMWELDSDWFKDVRDAVDDLRDRFPESEIVCRLLFLKPDGTPTHPDIPDVDYSLPI